MAACFARPAHVPTHPLWTNRKRHRTSLDDDPDALPTPSHPQKRRRSDLEQGFASLSLRNRTPSPPHTCPPLFPASGLCPGPSNAPTIEEISDESNDVPMDMDTTPEVQSSAYTVEEPDVPEITMKTSSWYELEPDRIVITDLDTFNESDDEAERQQSHVVNPALLEHIRSRQVAQPLTPVPPSTSQALVLFRPLPIIRPIVEEVPDNGDSPDRRSSFMDDIPMDVNI